MNYNVTKLYVVEDPEKSTDKRLICTIRSGDKFKTMPWWNRIEDGSTLDPDTQFRAAMDQMSGWKNNGPWPNATFEIEQFGDNGELLMRQDNF